jgi:hypothetical protein
MSVATRAPFPVSRGLTTAMAAVGPVAIGGILAIRAHDPGPMLAAPAIVFGVVAATAPALYIASAAAGHAPPLAAVVRAFGVALGAFGLALAGLILPAAFVSLSSVSPQTTIAVATAAIAAAGLLGLVRLASELRAGMAAAAAAPWSSLGSSAVFVIWAGAIATIAGRLWWDLAVEVVS